MSRKSSKSSPEPVPSLLHASLERVDGPNGLADLLAECKVSSSDSPWIVILDFDRTLTTGFAKPDGEDEIVKDRIRGGSSTVAALADAKECGSQLYIVTARRAVESTVLQIFASLDRAQGTVGHLFNRGDGVETVNFLDVPLIHGGSVYASDYNKPTAVAHMIASLTKAENYGASGSVNVLFVDDACINAHQVYMSLAERLHAAGLDDVIPKVSLRSVWWDPILEDLGGPNQSMRPVATTSSDFNYHEHLRNVLEQYGIDEKVRLQRMKLYQDYEEQNGKPVAKVEPLRKPKKLSIGNKFASLATMFTKPPPQPPKTT